jgi:hypothetical protein
MFSIRSPHRSFRTQQAGAVSFTFASCERVGLRREKSLCRVPQVRFENLGLGLILSPRVADPALSLGNSQRSTPAIVRKFHWWFCPKGTKHSTVGGIMSITTEILSLRLDRSSSVAALINAMEWQCAAEDDTHILSRGYDVLRMADIVLLNVAAHAADALGQPPAIPKVRRAALSLRRKRRRPDPGHLHQRRLFA